MSSIKMAHFNENQLKTLFKALEYAGTLVTQHYNRVAESVDQSLQEPIQEAMKKAIAPVTKTFEFLKSGRHVTFNDDEYFYFMDTIRSSLEVYRLHMEEVQKITGVDGYNSVIEDIKKISPSDGPSQGKKTFFQNIMKEVQKRKFKRNPSKSLFRIKTRMS